MSIHSLEMTTSPKDIPLYEKIGGHATFQELVHHFYTQVIIDPILGPMYPEEDLQAAEERLLMFLEQFFGGPTTYSELRGHPRLRMRHSNFKIDYTASQAWLAAMDYAMEQMKDKIPSPEQNEMKKYFANAALALINS